MCGPVLEGRSQESKSRAQDLWTELGKHAKGVLSRVID